MIIWIMPTPVHHAYCGYSLYNRQLFWKLQIQVRNIKLDDLFIYRAPVIILIFVRQYITINLYIYIYIHTYIYIYICIYMGIEIDRQRKGWNSAGIVHEIRGYLLKELNAMAQGKEWTMKRSNICYWSKHVITKIKKWVKINQGLIHTTLE